LEGNADSIRLALNIRYWLTKNMVLLREHI